MIPTFPAFKRLEIEDREEVEDSVRPFPPYSDFSFVSLVSWDVGGCCELSRLNENLVASLRDYTTGNPLLSFIGEHETSETAMALLDHAGSRGLEPVLRLVPEVVVTAMNAPGPVALDVREDRDSFDYVYSVPALAELRGATLKSKRRAVRAFRRRNPELTVELLDLTEPRAIKGIFALLDGWRMLKESSGREVATELAAIERCIRLASSVELVSIGVWVGGQLVAFTINERMQRGFCMGHFGKAIPTVKGASDFAEHATAQMMRRLGCRLINLQQDLGRPGLRSHKRRWRPTAYLKKFTVSHRRAAGGGQRPAVRLHRRHQPRSR